MANETRTGVLLVAIVAVAFATSRGWSSQSDSKANTRQAVPSATEVFHLRSECASLGEKILEADLVGQALTKSQTSHYDTATNRCYVELAVSTADLRHYEDYYARYLYDGQTGEMLAFTRSEKGHKSSNIVLPHDSKNSTGDLFWEANKIIDEMMADDRGRGQGPAAPNRQ